MGLVMQKKKSTYNWAHSIALWKYLGCRCFCIIRVPLTQDVLPFLADRLDICWVSVRRRGEPSEIRQPAQPRPEMGSGLLGSCSCTLTTKSPFSTEVSCSKNSRCCQTGATGRLHIKTAQKDYSLCRHSGHFA